MEALQKISDDPLRECPLCHEMKLQKLVSEASFRLKGGGWYETDFKSGDKKHLADNDKGEKGGSKSDASTKADTAGSASSDSKDSKKDTSKAGKSEKSGNSEAKSSAGPKSTAKTGGADN